VRKFHNQMQNVRNRYLNLIQNQNQVHSESASICVHLRLKFLSPQKPKRIWYETFR
jgi:hypothetical protein